MKSTIFTFFLTLLNVGLLSAQCDITIEATSPVGICIGDQVSITVTSSSSYSWNTVEFLNDPNSSTPISSPTNSITYIVTVDDTSCMTSDTLEILVDDFNIPTIENNVIEICQGTPIEIAPTTLDRRTQYRWSPSIYLIDSTASNAVSLPEDTTTYKLIATSENGFCSDSVEVTVNIIPIDVNIVQEDTVEVCLGEGTLLQATLSDLTLDWKWFPEDTTISDVQSVSVSIVTSISGFYGISITDSTTGCVAYDSVYVRVDSIPDMDTIIGIPFKEIYCPDDEILLFSRSYVHGNFPDMTHIWTPNDGSFKDDERMSLNAGITATSTKTFFRTTDNHKCRVVDTIRIEVVDPTVTVTPMDTTVCQGERVDVLAVYEPDPSFDDFEWMPEEGLSCTECDDPRITAVMPGTWNVQGEYMGCPIGGSTTVNLFAPPGVGLSAEPGNRVAVGTEVIITAITNSPDVTFSWEEGNSARPETGSTITAVSNTDETITFTVTVTDVNGCVNAVSISIEWFTPPFRVAIPKAFIPEGESENKIFMPLVEGVATLEEILVFNRFGQLVYKGIEGWDGMYKGSEAPSDTYMYLITVLKGNNERERYKGDVILFR